MRTMSDRTPLFDDVEYAIVGAGFVVANKDTGKPVFSMKRKEPIAPDGTTETYYLFRIHEENIPEEEGRKKVREVLEERIAPIAKQMGIGLFSFDEVSERSTEQVKKIFESGRRLTETQIDVTIKVFNHATQTVDSLIVGISTKPGELRDTTRGEQ